MMELEACPNQADVPPDLRIELCISCNTIGCIPHQYPVLITNTKYIKHNLKGLPFDPDKMYI